MQLYEVTTEPDTSGRKIKRFIGRLADNSDPEKQTEWINFGLKVNHCALGSSSRKLWMNALGEAIEKLESEKRRLEALERD
jgi:hypothetical protein